MKRTIKDIYNRIKEKIESAKHNAKIKSTLENKDEYWIFCGEVSAYQDILSLIESSHLLEEDKPVKGRGLEAFQKLKGYIPLDWEETKLVEKELKDYEKLKDNKSSRINYSSLIEEHLEELKALKIIEKISEGALRHFIATYVEDENERELVKKCCYE